MGYAAGPEALVDRMAKCQENFISGVNAAAQYAATYALEHRELTEGLREVFRERRKVAIAELKKIPGIKLSEPKGAFYLFPDISAFGSVGEGFIRMAYTAKTEDILEAMRRIREFCAKL